METEDVASNVAEAPSPSEIEEMQDGGNHAVKALSPTMDVKDISLKNIVANGSAIQSMESEMGDRSKTYLISKNSQEEVIDELNNGKREPPAPSTEDVVSRISLSPSKMMLLDNRLIQTPDLFMTELTPPPTASTALPTAESSPLTTQDNDDQMEQASDKPAKAYISTIDEDISQISSSVDDVETRPTTAAVPWFSPEIGSDEYDTDLEEEEPPKTPPDMYEEQLYLKLCKALKLVPNTYFIRNIKHEHFKMQYRGLDSKGARAMATPMGMNNNITTVNLSDNLLEAEGARYFAEMLDYNLYITEIDLSCNKIGTEGAEFIYKAFVNNTTVKKVNLSGNQFRDRDAGHFSEIIEQNTILKELQLSHNEFSSQAGILLGPALASNDALEILDLSWNHIRLEGAKEIAKGIAANVHLKKLDLHMNGFADSGTRMMGLAMTMNNTLEDLNLKNNRIPTDAAIDFSKCLTKNTGLMSLRLGNNPILHNGAFALVDAIKKNEETRLKVLDLEGFLVQEDFMDIVGEIQVRQPFKVKIGKVTSGKKMEGDTFKWNTDNPLEVLLIFMSERNLRLVDLFKSLDKDQSMSLSREEFITGLQQVNTPLTMSQFDELLDMLDKDGDGEIDLAEIMNINKEFKDIKLKAKKKYDDQQEKKKNPPPSESKVFASAVSALMTKVKKKQATKLAVNYSEKEDTENEVPGENKASLAGISALKKFKGLLS